MLSYVSNGQHFCPRCAAIMRESGFAMQPGIPYAGMRCESCNEVMKPKPALNGPTLWSLTLGPRKPLQRGMIHATISSSGTARLIP